MDRDWLAKEFEAGPGRGYGPCDKKCSHVSCDTAVKPEVRSSWPAAWLSPPIPLAAVSGGSFLALKIQRQGCSNEVLQRGFVDLVALVDVDGAPDFPIKAGVEQA